MMSDGARVELLSLPKQHGHLREISVGLESRDPGICTGNGQTGKKGSHRVMMKRVFLVPESEGALSPVINFKAPNRHDLT